MSKLDSILVPIFAADGPGYDADFCAWSEEQARRLRALQIPGVDIENIAEEIESLSRSDKRQLRSRMTVLLAHLLKWQFQPERAGSSWDQTIFEQRNEISDLLDESPSLRPTVAQVIASQYARALTQAAKETGIPKSTFPDICPWTVEQVLSTDFLPPPA